MAAGNVLERNIDRMNAAESFGVIMVCCSTDAQADYWQQRLEGGRGSLLPKDTLVACVNEDWPGGAGNALGTLYAFEKGAAKLKQLSNFDVKMKLASGKTSVGLYHTAGKGTRLAPLPGSENNNKPGVKLPGSVEVRGERHPITILEGVIKQTGCYASSRPGRLSVFWGDQIFIPSASVDYKVTHHADILCKLGPTPTAEEWKAQSLQNYGLIAVADDGNAAQVEKVDHPTAMKMLKSFGPIKSVGQSLGSFSVSSRLLSLLLSEFHDELSNKRGKMDTDPHLWMPMTLDKATYVAVMGTKGMTEQDASAHHDRIRNLLKRFQSDPANKKLGIFGAVDVGQGGCWWDYGQLQLYYKNVHLITHKSAEGDLYRRFFGQVDGGVVRSQGSAKLDARSYVSDCLLTGGRVSNSVLSNVKCNYIEAEDCILVNVTADRIIAKPHSIIYNVYEQSEEGLTVGEGEVFAGVVFADASQLVMRSKFSIDGGKAWDQVVEKNGKTFGQIYELNVDADPTRLERTIRQKHDAVWKAIRADADEEKAESAAAGRGGGANRRNGAAPNAEDAALLNNPPADSEPKEEGRLCEGLNCVLL